MNSWGSQLHRKKHKIPIIHVKQLFFSIAWLQPAWLSSLQWWAAHLHMLKHVTLILLPKEQNAISISSLHYCITYICIHAGFLCMSSSMLMNRHCPTWLLYTVMCAGWAEDLDFSLTPEAMKSYYMITYLSPGGRAAVLLRLCCCCCCCCAATAAVAVVALLLLLLLLCCCYCCATFHCLVEGPAHCSCLIVWWQGENMYEFFRNVVADVQSCDSAAHNTPATGVLTARAAWSRT